MVHQPKLGVYVNNRAAVFLDDYELSDLIELAVAAEAHGYDFVSVGDSLLAKPRYSPIVVLAGIAQATERIELSTGILQPHMRNPLMLAQEWATLDVLSRGRTTLGVGVGTGPLPLVEREYELIGIPKRKRGVAFEESIVLLRRLWAGESVSFEGDVFSLNDVAAGFDSAQSGGPPIYIACGGYVPTRAGVGPNDFYTDETAGRFTGPFDRVARLADGWITGIVRPGEYVTALAEIRDLMESVDRIAGSELTTRLNCFIHVDTDAGAARRHGVDFLQRYHGLPFDEETIERWLIAGPPEECAERLAAYVDAGVKQFQLVLASGDQHTQLVRIAETVRPLL